MSHFPTIMSSTNDSETDPALRYPPQSQATRYIYSKNGESGASGSTLVPEEETVPNDISPYVIRTSGIINIPEYFIFTRLRTDAMIRGELDKVTVHLLDVATFLNHILPFFELPVDPAVVYEGFKSEAEAASAASGNNQRGKKGKSTKKTAPGGSSNASRQQLPKFMERLLPTVFGPWVMEPEDEPPLPDGKTYANEELFCRFVNRLMKAAKKYFPAKSEEPDTPMADASTPGADASAPKADASTPGAGTSAPKAGARRTDTSAPKAEATARKTDTRPRKEDTGARTGRADKANTGTPNLKAEADTNEDEFPARFWSGFFHSKAPESGDSNIKRQPDFTIVKEGVEVEDIKRGDEGRLGWLHYDLAGELKAVEVMKTENESLDLVLDQLNNFAFCIFESQENRRFIIFFSLVGLLARISYYDRSGALHTKAFDIVEHPVTFIHLLLGLTFAAPHVIGFDPTISAPAADGRRHIQIAQRNYYIIKTIYRSVVIQGRATTVWLAVDSYGREVIIKDSWAHLGRYESEVDVLRIAKEAGVKGIPNLILFEDVYINGRKDTTDENHGALLDLPERTHRRLVFEDVAVPLAKFTTLRELFGGIRDCSIVHKGLFYWAKILHSDLSVPNMMFVRGPYPRHGMLIDLEYGVDMDPERFDTYKKNAIERYNAHIANLKREAEEAEAGRKVTKAKAKRSRRGRNRKAAQEVLEAALIQKQNEENHRELVQTHGMRTGTHPFMAGGKFLSEIPHSLAFDIESIYYCVLYFGLLYDGPGRHKEGGKIPKFFHNWLHPELVDAHSIGTSKYHHITCDDDTYEKSVLKHLTPYMRPIAECLKKLRNAIRNENTKTSHDAIIKIFDETIDALPAPTYDERFRTNPNGQDDDDDVFGGGDIDKQFRVKSIPFLLDDVNMSLNANVTAKVDRIKGQVIDGSNTTPDIDADTRYKMDELADFLLTMRTTQYAMDDQGNTSVIAVHSDASYTSEEDAPIVLPPAISAQTPQVSAHTSSDEDTPVILPPPPISSAQPPVTPVSARTRSAVASRSQQDPLPPALTTTSVAPRGRGRGRGRGRPPTHGRPPSPTEHP